MKKKNILLVMIFMFFIFGGYYYYNNYFVTIPKVSDSAYLSVKDNVSITISVKPESARIYYKLGKSYYKLYDKGKKIIY